MVAFGDVAPGQSIATKRDSSDVPVYLLGRWVRQLRSLVHLTRTSNFAGEDMSITKRATAEFFGTFWLVFGGCGSAVLAAAFPNLGIGFVGVAFAFGLTVLTMAYAIGPVSGCHLNPAVSVGLVAGKKFPASELPAYIIAQVVGGIVASGVLYVIASGKAGFHASWRICVQRVWGTLAWWVFTSRLPGGRSGSHHVLPLHHSGLHRTNERRKALLPSRLG